MKTGLVGIITDKHINMQTLMAFLLIKGRVKKHRGLALEMIHSTGENHGTGHHQRNHQFNFILDGCRGHHSLLLCLVCKEEWGRLGRMVCPWSNLPILHRHSSNNFLL
jgi:hypothetical protein